MKERPILFSGEMVQAILDGRKTQTRRVVKLLCPFPVVSAHPTGNSDGWIFHDRETTAKWTAEHYPSGGVKCPYGVPGDRLWVRETWADTNGESGPMISYQAGGDRFLVDDSFPVDYSRYPGCQFTMWCGDLRRGAPGHSWRPSIHMPRWASRITLEVTGVRVERLQDIVPYDAIKEGFGPYANEATIDCDTINPCDAFRDCWDSLYAKRGFGWNANPYVWVIEFRRDENA